MLGIGSREAARRAQKDTGSKETLARNGQRVEKSGVALTVENVSRKKSLGRFETAVQNRIYMIVDVLLETTDRNEAPYNPMYFKLKDSDGIEYSSTFASSKGALSSGTLYKGDKVRGSVVFEVREKASGFVLTYEPLVIFGGYGPIRVLLEN